MLLRRCSWHPRHFGHRFVYGIASWKGWRVTFTDGMCGWCLDIVRAENKARRKAAR